MNITGKTEIRALSLTELDHVSGGVVFASALTAGLAAVVTIAKPKLALKILDEHSERQTQVTQKITS